MMKKNRLFILAIILIAITAVAAVMHLSTREEVAKGQLKIKVHGEEKTMDLKDLSYETLSGVRVNGKGEEIPMEGNGIQMKNLLKTLGVENFEKVQVLADDSYTAEVNEAEISEDGKVCLFLQEEGGIRLVVFGDENSKRSVSDVVQLIVE